MLIIIDNAIEDVNNILQFDRLVITVDAEEGEMTRKKKIDEIKQFLETRKAKKYGLLYSCRVSKLGLLVTPKTIKRNPSSTKLRKYRNFYDVRLKDPELVAEKEGLRNQLVLSSQRTSSYRS